MSKAASKKKAASKRQRTAPETQPAVETGSSIVDHLLPKHRAVLDYYRSHPGCTEAEAYQKVYTRSALKSAQDNAPRIFRLPQAVEYLRQCADRVSQMADVEQARVVREIADIALVDPANLVGEDGQILPLRQMPIRARAAIAGFKTRTIRRETKDGGYETETTVEIKLAPKNQSLNMLMRHLGAYSDGAGELPLLILRNLTGDRSLDPEA